MKQITFLRHAKSDWAEEFLLDIDRPLNARGYKDAYAMGEWFLKNNQIPDFIYSSTGMRALSTALIFCRAINFNVQNFLLREQIYESELSDIYKLIHEQNNKTNHVMLVGHNPTFTAMCNDLLSEGFIDNLPTCGLMSLKFELNDWKNIQSNTGKLTYFQFPKEIKN